MKATTTFKEKLVNEYYQAISTGVKEYHIEDKCNTKLYLPLIVLLGEGNTQRGILKLADTIDRVFKPCCPDLKLSHIVHNIHKSLSASGKSLSADKNEYSELWNKAIKSFKVRNYLCVKANDLTSNLKP